MNKKLMIALALGTYFGFVLVRSEVVSWFRIQEMFRFQSFHMFGIIGVAVVIGIISVQLIKHFQVKAINGEAITFKPKTITKANFIGGGLFGLGWAMTGACPGPLYALVGNGNTVIIIALISALLGVYVYGAVKDKLPH